MLHFCHSMVPTSLVAAVVPREQQIGQRFIFIKWVMRWQQHTSSGVAVLTSIGVKGKGGLVRMFYIRWWHWRRTIPHFPSMDGILWRVCIPSLLLWR
jgi:hypothetical protein